MSCSVFSVKQTMHDVLWWMSSVPNEILKLHSKNIILVYDLISIFKCLQATHSQPKLPKDVTNNKKKKKRQYGGGGRRNHFTLTSALISEWFCVTVAIVRFYNLKILASFINLDILLFKSYKTLKEIVLILCNIYTHSK